MFLRSTQPLSCFLNLRGIPYCSCGLHEKNDTRCGKKKIKACGMCSFFTRFNGGRKELMPSSMHESLCSGPDLESDGWWNDTRVLNAGKKRATEWVSNVKVLLVQRWLTWLADKNRGEMIYEVTITIVKKKGLIHTWRRWMMLWLGQQIISVAPGEWWSAGHGGRRSESLWRGMYTVD